MLKSLLVNGALAGLLIATLVYAVKLNRRIGDLRRGREELDQAVQRFAAASADADRTMARLADLTNGQGRNLQDALKKGGSMVDDLKFLIERADTAADRLEAAVTQSRRPQAPTAALPPTPAATLAAKPTATITAAADGSALPENERRLLNALIGLR